MQVSTTRLGRCENIEQLVGLGGYSQSCVLTGAWYGKQDSLKLTGPCPGMRADMSWSTMTPGSRTTHRRLFYFWSLFCFWYHNRWQLMGRLATSSFRSPCRVFFLAQRRSVPPPPTLYGQPPTPPRLLGSPGAMWKPLERLFS